MIDYMKKLEKAQEKACGPWPEQLCYKTKAGREKKRQIGKCVESTGFGDSLDCGEDGKGKGGVEDDFWSHQRCTWETGVAMAKEVKEDWSIVTDSREGLNKIKIKHHQPDSVVVGDLCRKVFRSGRKVIMGWRVSKRYGSKGNKCRLLSYGNSICLPMINDNFKVTQSRLHPNNYLLGGKASEERIFVDGYLRLPRCWTRQESRLIYPIPKASRSTIVLRLRAFPCKAGISFLGLMPPSSQSLVPLGDKGQTHIIQFKNYQMGTFIHMNSGP